MADLDEKSAARITELRVALGREYGYRNQKEFAEALGITKQRWNNFENGYPVSRDVQQRLANKFPGLTRDYVAEGETRGLSSEMLRILGLVPKGSSLPGP